MAIKNYTTSIAAVQTVGEIQGILAAHGAKSVMMNYDEKREPCAILFVAETPLGDRLFKLPANIDAFQAVLQRQRVKCDREQATKVAWRNIKDWIASMMAILETEMVRFDEIFLPYMTTDKTGTTVYQLYESNKLPLLGDGQ